MEHCLNVVDGRLALLEWALAQAQVHTRKKLLEYASEAQLLCQALHVMRGTMAKLKHDEIELTHWQEEFLMTVRNIS